MKFDPEYHRAIFSMLDVWFSALVLTSNSETQNQHRIWLQPPNQQ